MMKCFKFFIPLLFIIILVSCNSGQSKVSEETGNDSAIENEVHPTFEGTFTGTTPCADCPGIKTTVVFNPDSTFIETMEYIDRNNTFSDSGKWDIVDSIITVSFPGKPNASERFFKIKSDSSVVILDGDKKEIESALAKFFILKKIK